MQIILCGNSPGELWGWVRPVASKLKGHDVWLFLLPCPYATGREKEVAGTFGISKIYTPKESLAYIFRGKSAHGMAFNKPVILHLGGDVMYTALLAKRLKAKAYAYQWGNKLWDRWMSGYFVNNENQKQKLLSRGIAPEKITVVGDLLAEIRDRPQLDSGNTVAGSAKNTSKSGPTVTFLPGSRWTEAYYMLPFYLRIAEIIKNKMPETEFRFSVSPFITEKQIIEIIQKRKKYYLDSSAGVLENENGRYRIRTENGTRIEAGFGEQYRFLSESDCVVTVPGTKCGEAGILGIPMVVLLPTNKLEVIPYPGIFDLAGKIPILGVSLKRLIGSIVLPKLGYLAQPNIVTGKEVVPELVGKLRAAPVADTVIDLLKNSQKRKKISQSLHQIYDSVKPGAENLVRHLLSGSA